MSALVPLLIFTILLAHSGAFLLPPTLQGNGSPKTLSATELAEQQHMAETMEKGIQEYRNLVAAIRQLKDAGLVGQLAELVGRDNQDVFMEMEHEQEEPRRACGKKLVEKVARLCVGTCTTKHDIATVACGQRLTDAQFIARCCPTSPRQALPKSFVF